jgi:hypothetical protein
MSVAVGGSGLFMRAATIPALRRRLEISGWLGHPSPYRRIWLDTWKPRRSVRDRQQGPVLKGTISLSTQNSTGSLLHLQIPRALNKTFPARNA